LSTVLTSKYRNQYENSTLMPIGTAPNRISPKKGGENQPEETVTY